MKNVVRNSGFTFYELIISIILTGIIIGAFLSLVSHRTSLLSNVKYWDQLSAVFMANLAEAQNRDLATLVAPGNCLIRKFSRNGKFISETNALLSSDKCSSKGALTDDNIEVVWRISGADAIQANFEPATHLKLPKYEASVFQIDLIGRLRSGSPAMNELKLNVTIFRK